jgi:DNA invertase Pin-like site-specific DNA recombinase
MTVIGCARVSTTDQDLSIQESALRAAGCDTIRAEKRSGTTTQGREELLIVLDFLRSGDVLMVTRIDRLARSIGDLQHIVRQVKARLVEGNRAADRHGHRCRQVLSRYARRLRRIRNEPPSRAPARRHCQGQGSWRLQGPVRLNRRGQGARDAQGLGATEIAKTLRIGRASVYRVLETSP